MLTTEQALEQNEFTVITCGGGKNFTALIWEWYQRKLKRPDLIIFSDTGAELKATYAHLVKMNNWLLSIGYPEITICHAGQLQNKQIKLNEVCKEKSTLPAVAFGAKSCSLRFKKEQVDIYLNNYQPAKDVWGKYRKLSDIKSKITRVIGFDAGEDHRVKETSCEKYDVVYPLYDWDMDRDDCIEAIENSPLPMPPKSSCYMCPNMKTHEILEMAENEPDSLKAALEIEDGFLRSDAAKGRMVKTKVLRRIDNNTMIGIVDDMDKKEVNYLLGKIETNFEAGGLALEFIQPEPFAVIVEEDVWQPSTIRGLGRSYSWREVLANPELQVGSDMPCMCND